MGPDSIGDLAYEWRFIVAEHGAEQHAAVSPNDAIPLPGVPKSTTINVEFAADRAREALVPWQDTSLRERANIIRRFHDIVLREQEAVLDLIQRETGKARAHAVEEVMHVAISARFYAHNVKKFMRTRREIGAFPLATKTRVTHQPKGVVGVISPWNYPLSLAVCDAIPALLSGNAVIVKPDSQTVWTALWAVEKMYEAGLPEHLLQVVVGDGPVTGTALIDNVDYICFTGSTATGRVVGAQAGSRLIGSSLELGGKNAMIICPDADLSTSIEVAVRACFASAGQLCVSTERIYVHRSIADDFLEGFVKATKSLELGSQVGWGYDVGSLISESAVRRVTNAVNEAFAAGARVVAGGNHRPDLGPFVFEPTILINTTDNMRIVREETFGPVVSVMIYDEIDEAIERANRSPYGLHASVITSDALEGERIAGLLRTGSVTLNDGYAASFGSLAAPMGGMKDSGLGRRHGKEGMLRFTESQTVSRQRFLRTGPNFGLDEQDWAKLMTATLRVLKALRIR